MGDLNPSKIIDKLKDESRLKAKTNVNLLQKINDVINKIEKRKKKIVDWGEMAVQGKSDLKEMFRDASVFELNFAKHNSY